MLQYIEHLFSDVKGFVNSSMDIVLLMFEVKLIRISSAGAGGLSVCIFSFFARLAFVSGFCVPCKCAKNSVGQRRQSLE
ncbi:MAG: hypothetical protein WKF97_16565 [Chitinophagaceae bacterium]